MYAYKVLIYTFNVYIYIYLVHVNIVIYVNCLCKSARRKIYYLSTTKFGFCFLNIIYVQPVLMSFTIL